MPRYLLPILLWRTTLAFAGACYAARTLCTNVTANSVRLVTEPAWLTNDPVHILIIGSDYAAVVMLSLSLCWCQKATVVPSLPYHNRQVVMATIVIIQSPSIHSHTVVVMPSWSFYCRHFTIIIIVFVIQWSCHSRHLIVHIPLLCHRHCVIIIHSLSCRHDAVVVIPSSSF